MAKNSLRTELLTWEREKARLFAESPGKYVLIKGDEVIGVYDTQAYGIREGWVRFPRQPILVHLIQFEEPRNIPEDHGAAVRVEIEWEDGMVQTVRGADAERYMEIEGSASFMAANHGMRFKPLPWEYRGPAKPRVWDGEMVALVKWRNQLTDRCGEELVSFVLAEFRDGWDPRMTAAQDEALRRFRAMTVDEQEALVRDTLDEHGGGEEE